MKKIRLWKVILLYLVTLGIYGVVWLARRRAELIRQTKQDIPHWLWLITPALATIVLSLLALLLMALLNTSGFVSFMAFMLVFMTGFAISFGVSLWWMYHFGRATETITRGRFPNLWVMLFWVFLGSAVILPLQYRFNRLKKGIGREEPTKRFIALSLAVITLSILSGALSFVLYPPEDMNFGSIDAIHKKTQQVDQLTERYDKCIDTLEKDFPGDLTEENEAAYDTRYDKCDDIYKRQKAAIDELNKM